MFLRRNQKFIVLRKKMTEFVKASIILGSAYITGCALHAYMTTNSYTTPFIKDISNAALCLVLLQGLRELACDYLKGKDN